MNHVYDIINFLKYHVIKKFLMKQFNNIFIFSYLLDSIDFSHMNALDKNIDTNIVKRIRTLHMNLIYI